MNQNPDTGAVTRLLGKLRDGDGGAMGELMPFVYDELRRIASRHLRGQPSSHTLNTTALVHEAFLKLAGAGNPAWADRCHFYAVAATAMRQVLVDHARRRSAGKRGGGWQRVDIDPSELDIEQQADLILDIDDALQKLSKLDARLTQVVECRFFAGMDEKETGAAPGITDRTVRRDWVRARAWLNRELGASPPSA